MSTVRLSRSNLTRRVLSPLAALALLGLGGCVAYPAYGPGYAGGYYAPGAYYDGGYAPGYAYGPGYAYAPAVVIGGGGYYGGGGGWNGHGGGWNGGGGGWGGGGGGGGGGHH